MIPTNADSSACRSGLVTKIFSSHFLALTISTRRLEAIVTAKKFRSLALRLPGAQEASHMGHPDFRVGGKVFATLGPKEGWGMVKLTPEQQAVFLRDEPGIFHPASGAWGRRGCSIVQLRKFKELSVRHALLEAWRNTAPRRLVQQFDEGGVGKRG